MVSERLVFLLAINVTANLIGVTNSGKAKEESIHIATTPPHSKYILLDQHDKDVASSEARRNTRATNDTSFKSSSVNESAKKFDPPAVRIGSFLPKNHTTLEILVRETVPSDLGLLNHGRIDFGKDTTRTLRIRRRETAKGNDVDVELGNKSKMKTKTIANVKKFSKKEAEQPEQTRHYEQLPPKTTKRISDKTRVRNGPKNGRPHDNPDKEPLNGSIGMSHMGLVVKPIKDQAKSAIHEAAHENHRQTREARRPRLLYPYRDYYSDYYGGFDYYYPYGPHGPWKGRNEGGEIGDSRERRKGILKVKKNKKAKHTSIGKSRKTQELNDIDDRDYFDGGHGTIEYHPDDDDDLQDYEYLQRAKRNLEDEEEGSKANTLNKSFGLRLAQDQPVGIEPVPEWSHAKSFWLRTQLNRLVVGVNSSKKGASGAAIKPVNPPRASNRTTVKVPTPPKMLALCSDNVCANGGTCLRSSIRGIICLCPTGYSGKTCENRSDPCIRHPCQNGATCIFADKTLPMSCQCPPGFTGKLCQIDVNECSSDPCLNGGRCMDNVDGYSCKCLLGFEGQRCEANTDDCLGRICANGGRCIDGLNRYRCQCRPGFFGRHCQRVSDACLRRPCFNGGECIAMDSRGHFYKCLCRTGYLGSRCEIQAARCVHTWCQNGGTCMEAAGSFQCLCPPGLTGNLCESEVNIGVHKCQPDVCQRRGTCVDTFPGYRCECPIEAVGDRCQFDRDSCLPNPCVNGGQCIPTGGPFYFCLCDQQFAGKICQFGTSPCAGNKTCENGGTCLEYLLQRRLNRRLRRPCIGEKCRSVKQHARKEWTVIRCVCPLLYTGPRCTVRNLPCTIGVCAAGQECKEDPHNPVEGYSCLDMNQSVVALEIGMNRSEEVPEDTSTSGHEHRLMVSHTAAILFGAAMIVAIFGIAFLANGYTYFRSKKDNEYEPLRNEQRHIVPDVRTQMKHLRT